MTSVKRDGLSLGNATKGSLPARSGRFIRDCLDWTKVCAKDQAGNILLIAMKRIGSAWINQRRLQPIQAFVRVAETHGKTV